jgi:hypothetical protein
LAPVANRSARPWQTITTQHEHSRKPDEAYERIEALCEGPYLEVFARNRRSGWDSFGIDVDAFSGGKIPKPALGVYELPRSFGTGFRMIGSRGR